MEEKSVYELAQEEQEAQSREQEMSSQEQEGNSHAAESQIAEQGDFTLIGGAESTIPVQSDLNLVTGSETTIYAGDALNQSIYGNGETNANIYGVGNTDIYGGAMHNTTIYDMNQSHEQQAPSQEQMQSFEPSQPTAGQDNTEAQKAAMIEDMRARREQERSSDNEHGR